MQRVCYILSALVILCATTLFVINAFNDPLEWKRAWLERELERVPSNINADELTPWKFDAWQASLAAKPKVWDALIPPPPPRKRRPKPPTPPDLVKMLKGVRPTLVTIGKRIKINLPDNSSGALFGLGDTLGSCKLKSFSREEVTFSYYWDKGKKELQHTMKRW